MRRWAEALPDRAALTAAIGRPIHSLRAVGGGDHRAAYRAETDAGPLFVKCAPGPGEQVFAAEAAGLEALAGARAVRIPQVLAVGSVAGGAFLALEWIDFSTADRECEARLGAGLAQVHRVFGPGFGWERDNSIGATPQVNGWQSDWPHFICRTALGDAARAGAIQRGGAGAAGAR